MDLTTLQLNKIKEEFRKRASAAEGRVIVCAGTGCLVNGSLKVYEEFVQSARAAGLNAIVELKSGRTGRFRIEERLSGVLPDRSSRDDTARGYILHKGKTG